jgi:hypothetical protein
MAASVGDLRPVTVSRVTAMDDQKAERPKKLKWFVFNIFAINSFKFIVLTEKYPRKLLKDIACGRSRDISLPNS